MKVKRSHAHNVNTKLLGKSTFRDIYYQFMNNKRFHEHIWNTWKIQGNSERTPSYPYETRFPLEPDCLVFVV